jgi:pimeloyl-ACP methyl ester carboxylesterase
MNATTIDGPGAQSRSPTRARWAGRGRGAPGAAGRMAGGDRVRPGRRTRDRGPGGGPTRRAFTAAAAAAAGALIAPAALHDVTIAWRGVAMASSAPQTGYAPVNGLRLYYEVHGSGRPLVLLHGGVGAIEMFGTVLPALAAGRQVVAADLQAHGRTADVDRPLRFELLADDVAALLRHLGIGRADLMGYSLGGGVALQTAVRHPDAVDRLVVVSTPFKRSGWYPEVLTGQALLGPAVAEPMKQTPLYQVYADVAPRPGDWPVLLTKLGELLGRDYDWSPEVAALRAPTLLVVGDADALPPAHAVEFFGLLGGGQRDAGFDRSGMSNARLAVLPGTTHYEIFASPALAAAATPFLDEPGQEAK